ncbi:MAG: DUF937 domain-containing protein [Cyanobacteria bacterium SID2]|nr:DUF937 domain-containing protein [Cyanobacteria bacterium SID2]MBP0003657.1 DUF937 domain-containing protein [Cyanobacteria bacterium SBC]
MGLFDRIANAINDPNLQASASQLGSIVNTFQNSSDREGLDPATTQVLMSAIGQQVRSTLREKRGQEGESAVQALVNQFAGTDANRQAVQSLFSPQQQDRVVEQTAGQTGVNADTIRALLPVLVPLVLNFLKTGASNPNSETEANPVLSGFLDSDGDGDVDMGDVLRMASQFVDR